MFEMVNLTKRTAVTAEYKTTPHNSANKIIILPDMLRSFKSKPEIDMRKLFRISSFQKKILFNEPRMIDHLYKNIFSRKGLQHL